MGKSLSILAITIQVYNINGHSQSLDEDSPLPQTSNHLESNPIDKRNAILGQINNMFMEASFQSNTGVRHLLTAQHQTITPITTWDEYPKNPSKIQQLFAELDRRMMQEGKTVGIETFYVLFQRQLMNPDNAQNMQLLKHQYKEIEDNKTMIHFINCAIRYMQRLPFEGERWNAMNELLTKMIFDHHELEEMPSLKQKLLFSIENTCKAVMRNEMVEGRDIIPYFHDQFWIHAKQNGLLDTDTAGFIHFDRDLFKDREDKSLTGSFRGYGEAFVMIIQDSRYPYLREVNSFPIKFNYLWRVLNEGNHDLSKFGNYEEEEQIQIILAFRAVLVEYYEQGKISYPSEMHKEFGKQMGQLLSKNNAVHTFLEQNYRPGYKLARLPEEVVVFYKGD